MKKLVASLMALLMVFSIVAIAKPAMAYDGPDTFNMIANFDITTLDYVYNNKSSNGD